MRDALIVSVFSALPRTTLARGMGWLARSGLSRPLLRAFVWAYGLDLSEAQGSWDDWTTLDALFTRRLRPGARPIDPAPDALVSPVDGTVAWLGTTRGGAFEVAPGRAHDLARLLGEPVDGERDVAVLYLSPKDYHRVHAPRAGHVARFRYLPGTLWPVFPPAVRRLSDLFGRNERVVVDLDPDLRVVLVGAFGVGRIGLAFADLVSNDGQPPGDHAVTPPAALAAGDDLGVFHLGSTVVLVAPAGRCAWTPRVGDPVRMGRHLATWTAP
jgi:phosphatidylserine decarboxylase